MQHYLGGYFLIEGASTEKWMNRKLLPSVLYTPTHCICELHPDELCLTWVSSKPEAREEYRKRLGLDEQAFSKLQRQVDAWFNEEKYGWYSVFLDPGTAKAFAK